MRIHDLGFGRPLARRNFIGEFRVNWPRGGRRLQLGLTNGRAWEMTRGGRAPCRDFAKRRRRHRLLQFTGGITRTALSRRSDAFVAAADAGQVRLWRSPASIPPTEDHPFGIRVVSNRALLVDSGPRCTWSLLQGARDVSADDGTLAGLLSDACVGPREPRDAALKTSSLRKYKRMMFVGWVGAFRNCSRLCGTLPMSTRVSVATWRCDHSRASCRGGSSWGSSVSQTITVRRRVFEFADAGRRRAPAGRRRAVAQRHDHWRLRR